MDTANELKKLKVFISYAQEDQEVAKLVYDGLKDMGVTPWFDKENLVPGQPWADVIRSEITSCTFFVALLSKNSISKKGFVQKELKLAMDTLDLFPSDQIFLIPARLDDCKPVDAKLHSLHWANLFPSFKSGMKQVRQAILNSQPASQTSHSMSRHRKDPDFPIFKEYRVRFDPTLTSDLIHTLPSPDSPVVSLSWSIKDQHLAWLTDAHSLSVISTFSKGDNFSPLVRVFDNCHMFCWDPKEPFLYTASKSGGLLMFSSDGKPISQSTRFPEKQIKSLAYSMAIDRLLCGSENELYLLRRDDLSLETVLSLEYPAERITLSRNGRYCVVGGGVFDLKTQQLLQTLKKDITSYFDTQDNLIVIIDNFYDDDSAFSTLQIYSAPTFEPCSEEFLESYCLRKFTMYPKEKGFVSQLCIRQFLPIDNGRYILERGISAGVVGYDRWREPVPPITSDINNFNPSVLSVTFDKSLVASAKANEIRIWRIQNDKS